MRAQRVAPAVRTTLKVTSSQTFVRIRIALPSTIARTQKKTPGRNLPGAFVPTGQAGKPARPAEQGKLLRGRSRSGLAFLLLLAFLLRLLGLLGLLAFGRSSGGGL